VRRSYGTRACLRLVGPGYTGRWGATSLPNRWWSSLRASRAADGTWRVTGSGVRVDASDPLAGRLGLTTSEPSRVWAALPELAQALHCLIYALDKARQQFHNLQELACALP
jgi:hypothetical protein